MHLLLISLPSQHSTFVDAISGTLVILLIMFVWKVKKYPHKLSVPEILIALFICMVHYILPQTSGDFLTYKDFVEGAGFTNAALLSNYFEHFEKVYFIIVNFVHNDYFLFRLVVWGSSLFLFCMTVLRLQINFSTFIFFLSIYIMSGTSTSRVCLACAIAYYGFSFLIKPVFRKGSTLMSFTIGLFIIYLSLQFHRSALIFIALLPLSLIPLDKKKLLLVFFLFPLLVIVLRLGLFDFVLNYNQTDDSLFDAETASAYLQTSRKIFGPGHLIRLALYYLNCYTVLFFIIKCILNKSYNEWPKYIQSFANATLIVIVVSSTLIFLGDVTQTLFLRIMAFSFFTQGILFAYLLSRDFEIKWLNRIIWLMTGYVVYDIIYENLYLGGL